VFCLLILYALLRYCLFPLLFSISCIAAAKIGEGILLDHGTGLVIGETAVVGNWVSLMQVTAEISSPSPP
jgi:serine acetyltransferase